MEKDNVLLLSLTVNLACLLLSVIVSRFVYELEVAPIHSFSVCLACTWLVLALPMNAAMLCAVATFDKELEEKL